VGALFQRPRRRQRPHRQELTKDACEFPPLDGTLPAEMAPSDSGNEGSTCDTEPIRETRVRTFLGAVDEGPDNGLFWSESQWAAMLGIDAAHLGRLIKHHSGRSFREWRRLARVRRASRLLYDSDEQVSQIGYGAGFGDCSQFRREFVQVMGLSPVEFRSFLRTQLATGPSRRSTRDDR
jgi:AraC-like DNA-binding protein